MPEAVVIDAARTPRGVGKIGKGALAEHHPQHLGATVLKAIAERNNLNTAEVDDGFGASPASAASRAATWAGCRRWTPATTCAPQA